MNINDMLSNDGFLVNFDGTSKKHVLEELSKLAAKKLKLNPRTLLENLTKREKLGSTAVGNGIAIPHANVENIDKPYVFVTNIKNGTNHEVSIKAGFNFKKNKDVIFDVDGNKTKLFPVDDRAWSESTKVDRFLVQSMRRGQKLIVTGISTPGNKIIDTYSLSGFTKALRLIDKSCS